jgi:hypothetical protein
VRRVFALHDTDFVLVTSNWHKFVIWNFQDDSTPLVYNYGYNNINDVVVFPRTRTIAVSNSEMVLFIQTTILSCNDPLALTCETFDSEKSLTCKSSSSPTINTLPEVEGQLCFCDAATPYYNPDTETCGSTQFCDDDQANTCYTAEPLETITCIMNSVYDPIDKKCKCAIGAYFDNEASNPTELCAHCPNAPNPCNGPDLED